MKAISGVLLCSALILGSVGAAMGQGSDPNASGAASAGTRSQGTVDVNGPIDAQGNMTSATATKGEASTEAGMNAESRANADGSASAEANLSAIRERAKNTSAKTRAAVEKQLSEISREIDAEANQKGDVIVAGRIAPEFGMTSAAMMAEQSKLDVGMGELMIAHTLVSNSKTAVTAEQLFSLQHEGLGWGQIAHGLNLRLGEVAAAMKSEGNVAAGRAKADGKPAMIRSGTQVSTNTNAGVRAGRVSAGAASSVGLGVKLGK